MASAFLINHGHPLVSQTMKRSFVWLILAVSVLVNLASFTWDLYDQPWWYDKVVHVLTTFAFTLPLPLLLADRVFKGFRRYRLLILLIFAALGVALGTAWEILEWGLSELWQDPNLSEKRRDVITDLLMDSMGALLGALVGLRTLPSGSNDHSDVS